MRNSELRLVQLRDLDREAQLLRVEEGKGGKHRLVPLGEEALAWLAEYLACVRPQLVRKAEQTRLFLTRRGNTCAPTRWLNWSRAGPYAPD